MHRKIQDRRRGLTASARNSVALLGRWGRHEWDSLHGHWQELAERLQLARCAGNLGELVYGQLDLVPESRRRLQRNAEIRRALLAELRHLLRGGSSAG